MTDDHTPSMFTIRSVFSDYWTGEAIPSNHPDRERFRAEFDRGLAAHDHEVRVEWEKRRRPDPLLIENIDGIAAGRWLAEHDREVAEKAWDEGRDAHRDDVAWVAQGVRGETVNPYRTKEEHHG